MPGWQVFLFKTLGSVFLKSIPQVVVVVVTGCLISSALSLRCSSLSFLVCHAYYYDSILRLLFRRRRRRHRFFLFLICSRQGAATSVYAAVDPVAHPQLAGAYLGDSSGPVPFSHPLAGSDEEATKLWVVSERAVGLAA